MCPWRPQIRSLEQGHKWKWGLPGGTRTVTRWPSTSVCVSPRVMKFESCCQSQSIKMWTSIELASYNRGKAGGWGETRRPEPELIHLLRTVQGDGFHGPPEVIVMWTACSFAHLPRGHTSSDEICSSLVSKRPLSLSTSFSMIQQSRKTRQGRKQEGKSMLFVKWIDLLRLE